MKIFFYQFIVSGHKRGRCCNTLDDPYAEDCVPNKVKNMNAKVFNVKESGLNETFLAQHQSCKCKCRLNESICNPKQKWNHN